MQSIGWRAALFSFWTVLLVHSIQSSFVDSSAQTPPSAPPSVLLVSLTTIDQEIVSRQTQKQNREWCERLRSEGYTCDWIRFTSTPLERLSVRREFARFYVAQLVSQRTLRTVKQVDSIVETSLPTLDIPTYDMCIYLDGDVVIHPEASIDSLNQTFWDNTSNDTLISFASDGDSNPTPKLFAFPNDQRAAAMFQLLDSFRPTVTDSLEALSHVFASSHSHHKDTHINATSVMALGQIQLVAYLYPEIFERHTHTSSMPLLSTQSLTQSTAACEGAEHSIECIEAVASRLTSTWVHSTPPSHTHSQPLFMVSGLHMEYPVVLSAHKITQSKILDRIFGPFTPPADGAVEMGLVAYGEEHQREETPHFFRSLFAHRSSPIHFTLIGDTIGLSTLVEVMHDLIPSEMWLPEDRIHLLNMDTFSEWLHIQQRIHPHTKQRHPRLFIKLFTHDLLPHLSRVMMMDDDLLVLDDIKHLWDEFDEFEPTQLGSLTVDQSRGWYYRLQDPEDEYYSTGWVGLPHRYGINGGVQLWHNDHVRATRSDWSNWLIRLTHEGAQRSQTDLKLFGILQEQDLLNFAFIHSPEVWRPLDCVFNYLPKTVFGSSGGHLTEVKNGTMGTFIDRCVEEEDFGCSCGRRVRIAHFVGRTKHSNPQAPLLFQFWGHAPWPQLRMIAQQDLSVEDEDPTIIRQQAPAEGQGELGIPNPQQQPPDSTKQSPETGNDEL